MALHDQLHAKKRFGQNFLHDTKIIDRILHAANLVEGDPILEIGPGPGALTAALRVARTRLVAIELDRDAAALLRDRWPDLELYQQDALEADYEKICPMIEQEGGAPRGWKVIANLPYNVATHILMRLLREPQRFPFMLLMFQKEVADRILAPPNGDACGALSIQVQARSKVFRIMDIGPGAFVPAPKIDSTVLRFQPFANPDLGASPEIFDKVVRGAFSQRRKTLLNALGSTFGKDNAREMCEKAGINPGLRAEVLSISDFKKLAAAARE